MKKLNYARNYTEQLFKVCEINMNISAHEHADIATEAIFFSADVNAAKQRFFFTTDGEVVPLHRTATLMMKFQFPQGEYFENTFVIPVKNPEKAMFEWIIPKEILRAGNTEMIQHLYIIQPNSKVDPGLCRSTINRSILELIN